MAIDLLPIAPSATAGADFSAAFGVEQPADSAGADAAAASDFLNLIGTLLEHMGEQLAAVSGDAANATSTAPRERKPSAGAKQEESKDDTPSEGATDASDASGALAAQLPVAPTAVPVLLTLRLGAPVIAADPQPASGENTKSTMGTPAALTTADVSGKRSTNVSGQPAETLLEGGLAFRATIIPVVQPAPATEAGPAVPAVPQATVVVTPAVAAAKPAEPSAGVDSTPAAAAPSVAPDKPAVVGTQAHERTLPAAASHAIPSGRGAGGGTPVAAVTETPQHAEPDEPKPQSAQAPARTSTPLPVSNRAAHADARPTVTPEHTASPEPIAEAPERAPDPTPKVSREPKAASSRENAQTSEGAEAGGGTLPHAAPIAEAPARSHASPEQSSVAPVSSTAARPVVSAPPEPAVSAVRLEPEAPRTPPSAPVREIAVRVEPEASGAKVDLHVTERAGRVSVDVRTADPELTQSLRSNVGQLVTRLEESGYRSEATIPLSASRLHEAPQAAETSNQDQQSGRQQQQPHADADSSQHPSRRARQAWEEYFENTLYEDTYGRRS